MAPPKKPVPNNQERMNELYQQMTRGVQALTSAPAWISYLRLMHSTYRYSARNAMLIYLQKPDATIVHGYGDWQKLGRQVRRGEKALHVISPAGYEVTDDDKGNEVRRPRAFKVANVFDISQTDGPVLPDTMPGIVEGKAPEVIWEALARRVEQRGYTLVVKPIAVDGLEGWTRPSTREMCVDSGFPRAHQLAVLGHEVAHVELGHVTDEFDYIAHRSLAEVEAESVAFILAGFAGIDASASSFKYLAQWAGDKPELLFDVADNVQRVTHTILDACPEFTQGLSAKPAPARDNGRELGL